LEKTCSEPPKPLLLIILDGWGLREEREGNAILQAKTPNFDSFLNCFPHARLSASGEAVGLPDGQMGNSEVGHLNLGAGRIVYQEFTRINMAIKTGGFFKNPVLKKAFELGKNSRLHLLGLVSDGGVHSHEEHIYALLEMARREGVKELFVHAFLDGRDTPPKSALTYIKKLQKKMGEVGVGRIATVAGRYYAMDRDKRWERTKLAYEAIVYGKGEFAADAIQAVEKGYGRGETDEFIRPTVVGGLEGKRLVRDGDASIFFNFRPDRARQLSRAFIFPGFNEFDRGEEPPHVHFITMTQYDVRFPVPVAFPPEKLENVLADVLAENGLRQLRIAETEKYAHVTYFFNGGVEKPKPLEERVLIPSPKVPTYDLKPEMSAYEVAERVIKEMEKDIFDVIIMNFANPDMVGHTGVLKAAIKAIEAVDDCLGKVVRKVREVGGECFITGDHGNAEEMVDAFTGKPHTAHTTNPVPFIYLGKNNRALRDDGILADVAPTMLEVLRLKKPSEMKGESLFYAREVAASVEKC
jgi:2,3-bisphosphoglycerate-independent phosphoglycerate mutase